MGTHLPSCSAANLIYGKLQKGNPMEPFLGQIEFFPYTFAPRGWTTCSGQLMAINQNVALFSVFGTTFGGDGVTTFALPNLDGKEPAPGMRCYIALQGIWPSRD